MKINLAQECSRTKNFIQFQPRTKNSCIIIIKVQKIEQKLYKTALKMRARRREVDEGM